jgi:hypothetical protein
MAPQIVYPLFEVIRDEETKNTHDSSLLDDSRRQLCAPFRTVAEAEFPEDFRN